MTFTSKGEARNMPMGAQTTNGRLHTAYRHEALLYKGTDEFVDRVGAFVEAGIAADDGILVVVDQPKIDLLTARLGADARRVHFADMADVGRNPARIIPAWREFVDQFVPAGRAVRGVGEPIGPHRTGDVLVECHIHESLLNLAFADVPGFWLLCPYDVGLLPEHVVDEARVNHPFVDENGESDASSAFRDVMATGGALDGPLSAPPPHAASLHFDHLNLHDVRSFVARCATAAGVVDALNDITLSAHEVAANSVRHGGGAGVIRCWDDAHAFVCEVRDAGFIASPLVGREFPPREGTTGRGLWLANAVCDLVQIRSSDRGTVVRLHMLRTDS
jgi:anti-sigma regulatory factor (Ser/Thr protein kinase)